MQILIIEDDEFKKNNIETIIRDCQNSATVIFADCLYSAIQALDLGLFDLIVLDMAIPSHPATAGEGSPISFLTGGLDVLLELEANNRHDPCIVITQFPEIEISGRFYPVHEASAAIHSLLDYPVIDCISYSSDNDSWAIQFKNTLLNHGYSCS